MGGLIPAWGMALKHLKELGYSPGTVANYRNTWKVFQRFAQDREETETLSTDMVDLQDQILRS